MATSAFVTPNLYNLAGHGLHISYATTSLDGKPHFHYQDGQHNLDLSGDQIRTVPCDLGTLVSVTIQLTVDAGSTTFSVLIPRINMSPTEAAQIRTDGVITIHRFSLVPQLNHGQLDTYTVIPLRGTAQHVMFL